MEDKKSIYELELNERIKHVDKDTAGRTYIRRVPGGWVYTQVIPKGMSSCFVPFNKEFRKEDNGPTGLENL